MRVGRVSHAPAKAHVIAEDVDMRSAEVHSLAHHRRFQAGHRARSRRVAKNLGSDVGDDLVDQAGREGTAVQASATLEQHRVDAASTEGFQNRRKVDVARHIKAELEHLDAAATQAGSLLGALARNLAAGHEQGRLPGLGAADKRAILGQRQVRVAHHAQGVAAARQTAGKQGVVRRNRTRAHHDGRQAVAQGMAVLASDGARDPARVTRGTGDAAVGRHGPLSHHIGLARHDVAEKHLVDGIALVTQHINRHLDARLAQSGVALAGNKRVGVARAHDHARHASLDERAGARGLLAMMGARLERHVHRCAAGVLAASRTVSQRATLGMLLPVACMPALADHTPVAHDDRAHQRVGVRMSCTARRKLQRPAHERSIEGLPLAHSFELRTYRPCHHKPFLP